MREIVLDTETTGLDPATGDRIVEIGALELINHMPTGKQFHKYINPQRDMPEGAFAVHGLSEEFLSDKPLFAEIAQEFEDFIGTPITGIGVNAAMTPGRAAAPPAPDITTCTPLDFKLFT